MNRLIQVHTIRRFQKNISLKCVFRLLLCYRLSSGEEIVHLKNVNNVYITYSFFFHCMIKNKPLPPIFNLILFYS